MSFSNLNFKAAANIAKALSTSHLRARRKRSIEESGLSCCGARWETGGRRKGEAVSWEAKAKRGKTGKDTKIKVDFWKILETRKLQETVDWMLSPSLPERATPSLLSPLSSTGIPPSNSLKRLRIEIKLTQKRETHQEGRPILRSSTCVTFLSKLPSKFDLRFPHTCWKDHSLQGKSF